MRDLAAKLESGTVEAARLRQQVALLHTWCSSSASPLFNDADQTDATWCWNHEMDPAPGQDRGHRTREEERPRGYLHDAYEHVAAGWAADDSLRVGGHFSESGPGNHDGPEHHEHHKEPDEGHMRKRLEELGALRALRRAIQGQRSSGAHPPTPTPAHTHAHTGVRRQGALRSCRAPTEVPSRGQFFALLLRRFRPDISNLKNTQKSLFVMSDTSLGDPLSQWGAD